MSLFDVANILQISAAAAGATVAARHAGLISGSTPVTLAGVAMGILCMVVVIRMERALHKAGVALPRVFALAVLCIVPSGLLGFLAGAGAIRFLGVL